MYGQCVDESVCNAISLRVAVCGLSVVCSNEQFRFAVVGRGFNPPPLVEDDPTMATEKRRKGREGREGKNKKGERWK